MQDTILILVGSLIAGATSIVIFYVGFEIGKYVQALTVQEKLESISEQVSTIRNGLRTLNKELVELLTEDK
jgi:cell division protein FtsL